MQVTLSAVTAIFRFCRTDFCLNAPKMIILCQKSVYGSPKIYQHAAFSDGPRRRISTLGPALTIVAIGIVAVLSYVAFRRIVEPFVRFLVAKSPTRWDDDFFTDEVLRGSPNSVRPSLSTGCCESFAAHGAAYQRHREGNRHIYCMAGRLPCQQDNTFLFTAFEKRENERINSMKGIFPDVPSHCSSASG